MNNTMPQRSCHSGNNTPAHPSARLAALPGLIAVFLLALFLSCAGAPRAKDSVLSGLDIGAYFEERGIPRYPSTAPVLYFSSDAWASRAVELVSNARDYILISSFLVNSHPVNSKIFEALERKAREGVRVFIMFDSSSCFTYMPDMKTYLPTATSYFAGTSVRVSEYNPINGTKLFALPSLLDRDHRKFWIVDGEYFAAGGINLNYYSLAPSGEFSNIDTFVELRGAGILSRMVGSFCKTWNRYSPETIDPESFAISDMVRGSSGEPASSVWLIDQDFEKGSLVDPVFDAVFLYARKEIWMVQAYAFMTPGLLRKIESATRRGVKVRLLYSANAFRAAYDDAAKYCIAGLIRAGAEVFMFDAPDKSFLHYKLLLADGRLSVFGSPNFNFRSQYLSREIAIVSEDPEVGQLALENVGELMKNATLVTIEQARGYRGFRYLTAWLGMLFGG